VPVDIVAPRRAARGDAVPVTTEGVDVPIATSYPGVYIQEEASSVHTITGVPTSVAAFVGFAPRGPVDTATRVTSWTEYARIFGGLDPSSELSYAVFLFFANGGSVAQIVRVRSIVPTFDAAGKVKKDASGNVVTEVSNGAVAKFDLDPAVVLQATSPGTWANTLTVTVDHHNVGADQFNLTISHTDSNGVKATLERYPRITVGGLAGALAPSALLQVDPESTYLTAKKPPTDVADTPSVPPAPAPAAPPAAPAVGAAPAPVPPPAPPPPPPGAPTTPGDDIDPTGTPILMGDPANPGPKVGINALDAVEIFNILCLPSSPTQTTYAADTLGEVAQYCNAKRAMLIVDPPPEWKPQGGIPLSYATVSTGHPAISGNFKSNAAVYYPNIKITDPVTFAEVEKGPCGAVAGVWAATDASRGVWKAPAGTAAALTGVAALDTAIDDGESGTLNPLAVNCLRSLPLYGPVIWGARTCDGADDAASQWKYLPVRRTALFIEESLRRGTQWIVFEPNDEPLWAAIRLNVGAFMNSLFRQGAFQGSTPQQAYLVKCDKENNPQNDIDRGIVNILVGFAPLKPAEFVIIHIQQLAGQLQV
jgi:phage tail sheath protein FI